MKLLLTTLISLTIFSVHGKPLVTIHIKHKNEKYYLTKTCYDFLEWDAIILKNKAIENKINSAIRKRVNSYQLRGENAHLFCKKEMEYTFKFEIIYLNNSIASLALSKSVYLKDTPHPWTEFQTMNFSLETGNELTFSSLFDSSKISSIDSMILYKATKERLFDAMDSLELKQSILSDKFNINDEGIKIIYTYQNYPTDVLLTYKDLQPFILWQGPLKTMGQTTK